MYLGVDIGGTKTLVAVFENDGTILDQVKFPTPENYEEWKTELADVVASFATHSFTTAAVAVPGKINRENGSSIAYGNLVWNPEPIQADCEKILGCKVVVENDANLAGLSEAHLVKDTFHRVFYITISTGIGGIYVIDGVMDPDTIDAEIGQMIFEHKGKVQAWEDFASGKAIVATYGKRASEIDDPKIWKDISYDIAVGLYNLIATLTPDYIVIGGGVGAHLDRFKDALLEALHQFDNPLVVIPPIEQAKRAEEAVIYGCYELAKQHTA